MGAESIQIVRPDPTALINEVAPIVQYARSLEVVDVDTDRQAQEIGQQLRRAEKKWTEMCEPARVAADQAKKAILSLRDGIIGPWAEARSIVFAKSDAYQAEQRRIAEEESRRLQERARKEEEERQLQAAIAAEEHGDSQASEAILAEEVSAPVVIVAPAVAKVEGVATVTRWEPEIADVKKCIRWLLDRPEYDALWDRVAPVLVTFLRPFAVAQRAALAIPGVRAVARTIRSTR